MGHTEIVEPSRKTSLFGEYEVVVLGGGPAGIAAALAAGRSGRSTLLIERYGFLGGAGTAAGLSTFCGLHAVVHGKHEQVVHGIADDILDRLARDGRAEQAAPHDPRPDPRAGLRHLGLQDRGRRAARRSEGQRLFHAFGVGAVLAADDRDRRACSSRRSRAASRCAARSSSTARATAISPRGPACRTRSATARATCSIRRRCSASTASIPTRPAAPGS